MNVTMQTVEAGQKEEERPCPVCKKPGERKPIEGLPRNGVLWRVIHEGGRTCEWAEYDRFEDLRESREESIQMICPNCRQKGLVQSFRKDPKTHPDSYEYRVKHGQSVCEIVNQKQRRLVLKELGRYLFVCSMCKEAGIPTYYRTSNRFLIRHPNKPKKGPGESRCYVRTIKHKQLIAEECGLPSWLCNKPMGHNYLDS